MEKRLHVLAYLIKLLAKSLCLLSVIPLGCFLSFIWGDLRHPLFGVKKRGSSAELTHREPSAKQEENSEQKALPVAPQALILAEK